jgi:hypothetical protein
MICRDDTSAQKPRIPYLAEQRGKISALSPASIVESTVAETSSGEIKGLSWLGLANAARSRVCCLQKSPRRSRHRDLQRIRIPAAGCGLLPFKLSAQCKVPGGAEAGDFRS